MTVIDRAGVAESAEPGVPVGERLTVTGIVQGVGFRPFVARLATELGVAGAVWNTSTAVFVDATAAAETLDEFARRIDDDAPPMARVELVERTPIDLTAGYVSGFSILESGTEAGARSIVPPDAAVCSDCLAELRNPADRRFGHPFITCTNCGPRLTIIRDLPYDRPATTLAAFPMCDACAAEYADPHDRRYHAQPIGCHDCGPTLWVRRGDGSLAAPSAPPAELIDEAVDALVAGRVVAVKGLGGYQLMCRADRSASVDVLRVRKHRPDKPLAVMVADVGAARRVAVVSDLEASVLASPAAPIVLLRAGSDTLSSIAPNVAPRDPVTGIMLASTPVHHLLLDRWTEVAGSVPLVVTSANASGAPICHRDDEVGEVIAPLADLVLGHDRPIHVACDDSVVRVIDGDVVPIRRARGLAPEPIDLGATGRPRVVLAVGGELKNTVCLAVDGRAHLSPHVGDLENLATLAGFEQHVGDMSRFHDAEPDVVVADLHPDYLGTRWAERNHRARLVKVQHHHAHIAAVMAEHGLAPDRPVLGVALDGTGYGPDGTIWGGEWLVADAFGAERVGYLAPFRLPGGDMAVRSPWRVGLALLDAADVEWDPELPPTQAATPIELGLLRRQLDQDLACVPTSSMGRLFDGVASILGLRHDVTFEAHAAIELEIAAERAARPAVLAPLAWRPDGSLDHRPLIRSIVDAQRAGVATDDLAAGFHDALVTAIAEMAERHRDRSSDDIVVLSGGVFQNDRLVRDCRAALGALGFDVRTHRLVPPNDGGLSLGQAWIATHARAHADAVGHDAVPATSPDTASAQATTSEV